MRVSGGEFCFSVVMYPGNEHGYGTDEWRLSGSIRACRPSAWVYTDIIVSWGRRFVFSPTAEDTVTAVGGCRIDVRNVGNIGALSASTRLGEVSARAYVK